jgi:hypothetical protein
MMPGNELHEELLALAERLDDVVRQADVSEVQEPLDRLEKAAASVGKAWSGSELGYHARVYYQDLEPPPPGDHFSQEWGIHCPWPIESTTGDWAEYAAEDVERSIRERAGGCDTRPAQDLTRRAENVFESSKAEVLSILATALAERVDAFISALREQVEKTGVLSKNGILNRLLPPRQMMSRDVMALNQGRQIPPHLNVQAEVLAFRQGPAACGRLAELARKAGSHLSRQQRRSVRSREIGTNVFIGHGRSPIWRELKDFIHERLKLPWDEFNRVPVAGTANVARLAEMLDAAAIAFLVMTGEDELPGGKVQARLNVVHEAGLFQGRLGSRKP